MHTSALAPVRRKGIGAAWSDLNIVIRVTRMSVLMLLLGAGVLLLAPQSLDAVVALGERRSWNLWAGWSAFLAATTWWAVCLWYSARICLHLDPPWPLTERSTWRDLLVGGLPRLLSGLAFLSVFLILLRAHRLEPDGGILPVAGLVALAASAAHAFYRRRRRHLLRLDPGNTHYLRWSSLSPAARAWFGVFNLVSLALLAGVVAAPVAVGRLLSAGPLMLAAFAGWAAFGAWLAWLARRWNFPVVTALVILLVAFAYTNNTYPLRRLAGVAPPRPSLQQAFDRWYAHATKGRKFGEDGPPLVVVATAGGGIRAAYWTADVLGTIQDVFPQFRDYLFAVSGVSGGALGSTVFTNLLAVPPVNDCGYACRGTRILGEDFLGPAVAWMLYPDTLQKFLPWPVIDRALHYDRAAALEDAWEQSWRDNTPDPFSGRLANGFLANAVPGTDDGWRPIQLLNGTTVERGRRVLTTDVVPEGNLAGAVDFFGEVGGDVRSSTAATNSARFPLISPPGLAPRVKGADISIVDGGYVDNFGAWTAQELIEAIDTLATCKGPFGPIENCQPKPVHFVAIQIVSDPEATPRSSLLPPLDLASGLATLLQVREMIGYQSAEDLLLDVVKRGGHYFWFNLGERQKAGELHDPKALSQPLAADRPPPLGWVLAAPSRKYINDDIKALCPSAIRQDMAAVLGEAGGQCGG